MLVHKIRNKFIYTETILYFHFCYKSILVLIISYTSIDFGVWNGLRWLSRHKFPDSHTRKCYLVRSISGWLVGQHWLTHTIACITINIKTLNRWAFCLFLWHMQFSYQSVGDEAVRMFAQCTEIKVINIKKAMHCGNHVRCWLHWRHSSECYTANVILATHVAININNQRLSLMQ